MLANAVVDVSSLLRNCGATAVMRCCCCELVNSDNRGIAFPTPMLLGGE
jgi:hypothetical protein